MDRETEKALKASIAHWYRISACQTVNSAEIRFLESLLEE